MTQLRAIRKVCACCGAKITEYQHGLSKRLTHSLQVAYVVSNYRAVPFFPGTCDSLTHQEKCNFHKLQYWGFIRGAAAPGAWTVTEEAAEFLQGSTRAPKTVWTFRGELAQARPDDEPAPRVSIYEVDATWCPPTRQAAAQASRRHEPETQPLLF